MASLLSTRRHESRTRGQKEKKRKQQQQQQQNGARMEGPQFHVRHCFVAYFFFRFVPIFTGFSLILRKCFVCLFCLFFCDVGPFFFLPSFGAPVPPTGGSRPRGRDPPPWNRVGETPKRFIRSSGTSTGVDPKVGHW